MTWRARLVLWAIGVGAVVVLLAAAAHHLNKRADNAYQAGQRAAEVAALALVQDQEAKAQAAISGERLKQWRLQREVEQRDAEIVRLRKVGVKVVERTKVVTQEAPAVLPAAAAPGDDLLFKAEWEQVSLAADADPMKLWVKARANVNVRAVDKAGGADKWVLDVPLQLDPLLSTLERAEPAEGTVAAPAAAEAEAPSWHLGKFVGCGVGAVGAANVWPAGQAGTFGAGVGVFCGVGWGGVKARTPHGGKR